MYEHAVTVRFSDLDALGHVNNAIYLSYLEEARVHFFEEVVGTKEPQGYGFLLARMEIDFRREVTIDQTVVVRLWTEAIGTKSFRLGYEIVADDEVAAEAESVQVYVDGDGQTVPVPAEVREILSGLTR